MSSSSACFSSCCCNTNNNNNNTWWIITLWYFRLFHMLFIYIYIGRCRPLAGGEGAGIKSAGLYFTPCAQSADVFALAF